MVLLIRLIETILNLLWKARQPSGIPYLLVLGLVVCLILVVQKPRRAEQFHIYVIRPFFNWFKIGSRRYLALQVGNTSSELINREITSLIPSGKDVKVKVRWVSSPGEAVLKKDGTLILRLRETNDQTRNILMAAQTALPRVAFPTVRSSIQDHATIAIDLAMLNRFARKLGRHSYPVFTKHFLVPQTEKDARVRELFDELVEIDRNCYLVPMFLEELELVGEITYTGAPSDKTDDVIAFLNFLLRLARRPTGKRIKLDYTEGGFSVGVFIIGKTEKAEKAGIAPYLQAAEAKKVIGTESIYAIAYEQTFSVYRQLLRVLEADQQLTLLKDVALSHVDERGDEIERVRMAHYRLNRVFSDLSFDERAEATAIVPGKLVSCRVLDVSRDSVVFDVDGLNGLLRISDIGDPKVSDCRQAFSEDETHELVVTKIDSTWRRFELGLPKPDEPWDQEKPWARVKMLFPVGKIVRATVTEVSPNGVIVELPERFTGSLQRNQLLQAGYEYREFTTTVVPGQGMHVVVVGYNYEAKKILLDLARNQNTRRRRGRSR